MKTSRRLLYGTFAVLLAAPVVLVAYSRFTGSGPTDLPPPERTAPAELAALRDFTAVDVSGDFALEVVRADTWSIAYTPLAENRGNFTASVQEGTLVVEGFGNRTENANARVRIGMPDLDALEAGYLPAITIRDFEGDALELNIGVAEELVLEDNRFDVLQAELTRVGLVSMRGNTVGSSRVTHFGMTLTTE